VLLPAVGAVVHIKFLSRFDCGYKGDNDSIVGGVELRLDVIRMMEPVVDVSFLGSPRRHEGYVGGPICRHPLAMGPRSGEGRGRAAPSPRCWWSEAGRVRVLEASAFDRCVVPEGAGLLLAQRLPGCPGSCVPDERIVWPGLLLARDFDHIPLRHGAVWFPDRWGMVWWLVVAGDQRCAVRIRRGW